MLARMIERVWRASRVDTVAVATAERVSDDIIVALCREMGCEVYRGSENNMLDRLLGAARAFDVEVYAAFFVLEHIPDVHEVFRAFAEKPPGTLQAFSVPVFSLATVLESAFDVHAPRNLDSVLHTQLFTDASIRRRLELGGLRPVSQRFLGQDASDLCRLLARALTPAYPAELVDEVDTRLAAMKDGLQQVVDRAFLRRQARYGRTRASRGLILLLKRRSMRAGTLFPSQEQRRTFCPRLARDRGRPFRVAKAKENGLADCWARTPTLSKKCCVLFPSGTPIRPR